MFYLTGCTVISNDWRNMGIALGGTCCGHSHYC